MKTFVFDVLRTETKTFRFSVWAKTLEEAESLALDEASDHDYSISSTIGDPTYDPYCIAIDPPPVIKEN